MSKAQGDLYRGRGEYRVGAERLERYAMGAPICMRRSPITTSEPSSAWTRPHPFRAAQRVQSTSIRHLFLDHHYTQATTQEMTTEIEMDDLKARKEAQNAAGEAPGAADTPKYRGGRLNQDADQEQAVALWSYVSTALYAATS